MQQVIANLVQETQVVPCCFCCRRRVWHAEQAGRLSRPRLAIRKYGDVIALPVAGRRLFYDVGNNGQLTQRNTSTLLSLSDVDILEQEGRWGKDSPRK